MQEGRPSPLERTRGLGSGCRPEHHLYVSGNRRDPVGHGSFQSGDKELKPLYMPVTYTSMKLMKKQNFIYELSSALSFTALWGNRIPTS